MPETPIKISEYNEKTVLVDDDLLEIVDSEASPTENKKVTIGNLFKYSGVPEFGGLILAGDLLSNGVDDLNIGSDSYPVKDVVVAGSLQCITDNEEVRMGEGPQYGRIIGASEHTMHIAFNVSLKSGSWVKDDETGRFASTYAIRGAEDLSDTAFLWYVTGLNDTIWNQIMTLTGEGDLDIDGNFSIAETQILTVQQAFIADLSTSYSCANWACVNNALSVIATKVNAILSMVKTHGLIASS